MSELFQSLDQNPFCSGGLTLMVIGSAVAMLRRVPGQIWSFLECRLLISVEIPDRDPAFRWVQTWLAAQSYAQRTHDLSLTTIWVSAEPDPTADGDPDYDDSSGPAAQAKFLLSPAPGVHVMTYRSRILILHRRHRDLQNGGSMAFQES